MSGLSDEARLLERYAPLVRRIVGALQSMRPPLLDPEDAYQDGMVGLLRAIRNNASAVSEAQFLSYAGQNIRGAVIDGYRAAGEQSRSAYADARRIRQAIAAGEPVSAEERARAEQFFAEAWAPALSLDPTDGDALQVVDPRPGPEQRTESNRLLRRAIDALQDCSLRDRNIFIACELNGELRGHVAACYHLSAGRVSQIIKAVRAHILQALA